MNNYIIDNNNIYNQQITTLLRSYNSVFTGKKETKTKYYYVLDNDILIGLVSADLSWDNVGLDDIYYQNLEVLKCLITYVASDFHDISEKLNVRIDDLTIHNDLLSIGFSESGKIIGTSLLPTYYYSELKTLLIHTSVIDKYKVIKSDKEITKYTRQSTYVDDPLEKNLNVIALDKETFIGGANISIYFKAMNINRLIVDSKYRNLNIGSTLMMKIEEIAINQNVEKIYVGTTEFQAKDFYLKHGFEIVMTRSNIPRGYLNYKLVKNLKR